MKVIKPITVTSAILTSSIQEPDPSVGEVAWTSGTYTLGQRRILASTHKVYEVVATSTTAQPETGGVVSDDWVVVGATNKFACFDDVIDSRATTSSHFEMTITPPGIVNSVAGFGLVGVGSVQIVVTDSVDGEVYNETLDLTDDSMVIDEYTWCFSPVVFRTNFAVTDLPAYISPDIDITFDGDTTLGVGELVLGSALTLGQASYGTNVQMLDFSVVERDAFGNRVVVRRRTAKLTEFSVGVMKNRLNYVYNILDDLRTIPCVWIGEGNEDDATLTFGYHTSNRLPIETPTMNNVIITVEGLT